MALGQERIPKNYEKTYWFCPLLHYGEGRTIRLLRCNPKKERSIQQVSKRRTVNPSPSTEQFTNSKKKTSEGRGPSPSRCKRLMTPGARSARSNPAQRPLCGQPTNQSAPRSAWPGRCLYCGDLIFPLRGSVTQIRARS
jgi:hypothetical protein